MAKSANLLVDGYAAPERVGLLLPLHWQTICLLLAGIATGATVVVARDPAELEGCPLAFASAAAADAALTVGVDDVLALSGSPLGAPAADLPPLAVDYAREVPSYGDSWGGPAPDGARVEVGGVPVVAATTRLEAGDRVLWALPLSGAHAVGLLLGCLQAGAALVLVPDPAAVDLASACRSEGVTATVGLAIEGLPRLD